MERDVERWLAEAVIAADVASGEFGWDTGGEDDVEDDGKERWALNKFCDALLEKGMIVPLSKKCVISLRVALQCWNANG